MTLLNTNTINGKIIEIRNQKVLLDSDVAELYGVETKHINQAVSRNMDKFPEEYIFEITAPEWNLLKSQIVTSPLGGGRAYIPKAFTERGLYMLATILKSPKATAATCI
ncbi:MAG TPA: ORF6N domain-containing protein [Aquella sp.]|nr:ORF6N domain-containing protein [Aquella sp.]